MNTKRIGNIGEAIAIVELIEYNNIRSDKKDARLQDGIDSNREALKKLRKEHPDSNKK